MPGPAGQERCDRRWVFGVVEHQQPPLSRRCNALSSRVTAVSAGSVAAATSRARASSANRSGIRVGSSAATHHTRS